MENASKALIMAAEILIGVMIISAGVYLFNTFGSYSADATKKIEQAQIDTFNDQFLKYYGSVTKYDETKKQDVVEPVKCTIHDIVNLANLAKKNNTELGLENESGYASNTRYIQIDIKGSRSKNLEKKKEEDLTKLIKDNDLAKDKDSKITAKTKYYKCIECKINENTKYVNYMKFEEI